MRRAIFQAIADPLDQSRKIMEQRFKQLDDVLYTVKNKKK